MITAKEALKLTRDKDVVHKEKLAVELIWITRGIETTADDGASKMLYFLKYDELRPAVKDSLKGLGYKVVDGQSNGLEISWTGND